MADQHHHFVIAPRPRSESLAYLDGYRAGANRALARIDAGDTIDEARRFIDQAIGLAASTLHAPEPPAPRDPTYL